MITLKPHNILDYIIGTMMILAPYIFGFSETVLARDVFLVLGFGLLGYSLLTDYFLSVSKVIPFKMHLGFDVITGGLLMLAPALYGYSDELTRFQYALHFILGVATIGLAVLTARGSEPPALLADTETEADTTEPKAA